MGKEIMGGSWFAWETGWIIGLWWCMINQMGNKNYKIQ
jgi:hypothetical protein